MGDHLIFDRGLLALRRSRAARRLPEVDFLLERLAEDLVERLSIIQRDFAVAANLGAHHGLLSDRIAELDHVGEVVDLDASRSVMTADGRLRVVADEEVLPFADESLDLVVSGLALQHVNDLPGTLIQIRRALKPDGLFLAGVLGGQTLQELRLAWVMAEQELTGGVSPRVAPFADVREYGSLLQRAGFALPVVDADIVTVTYETPLKLFGELKAMGASNVLNDRRRVPVTRGLLMRACEIYAERFGLPDGRVPATFEILTLTAWAPHESQQKPLKPGSASSRLADALGTVERSAGEKASGAALGDDRSGRRSPGALPDRPEGEGER